MKSFVIYDIEGNIKRYGKCQDEYFDLQAQDGEYIVEHGEVDSDKYLYVDGQFVEKPPKQYTAEEVQAKIREQRNQLLKNTDWTQVPDSPVDSAVWATYRQALRDLPSQYQSETDFANVVFPNPPE